MLACVLQEGHRPSEGPAPTKGGLWEGTEAKRRERGPMGEPAGLRVSQLDCCAHLSIAVVSKLRLPTAWGRGRWSGPQESCTSLKCRRPHLIWKMGSLDLTFTPGEAVSEGACRILSVGGGLKPSRGPEGPAFPTCTC